MSERAKRTWSGPRLIVLERGQPEESVLTNCKDGIDGHQQSPIRFNIACRSQYPSCVDCSYMGTS
jgi:hypothetical protein